MDKSKRNQNKKSQHQNTNPKRKLSENSSNDENTLKMKKEESIE